MKNLCFFMLAMGLFALSSCEKNDDLSPSLLNNESGQAMTPGTTLSTISVDQFTWIEGLPSWRQASENRLYSSKFIFGASGNFTYAFRYDNAHTYTLSGEYYPDGNEYVFIAGGSTSNNAGSGTQILVQGSIRPKSNGQYRVQMEYGSSANYSAIVNNQQFLNSASKRFRAVMTVE
ncbi:MAG: hypothetical protein J5I94_04810 [Phaeodactylibacter sp.]|nr:hypothetical protein [Phaeodactylibacter sp.]